ncbi:MAG: hypothetical protein IPN95_01055 [Bacteroidetes bacterium]|nr:hypothetical protein [Bacteroidota bacterium]MBP8074331.1 hypothetical protein [Bacteroidia bacterium]
MNIRLSLAAILTILWGATYSQSIFISRIVPGNYLSDNRHRVEFSNPANKVQSLEGYLLVTRDYSVRLPAEARVPARGTFVLAKNPALGVNLSMATTPDFLIRFPMVEHEGNYLVLFDPNGRIVEALYFSPVPNVPFLPDRDTLYTYSREKIPYYIPPENRTIWSHFTAGSNPSNVFVKTNGTWRSSNILEKPATDYQNVTVRYKEGIMSLRWTTTFENGSKLHIVERSTDIEQFEPLDTLNSQGDSRTMRQYVFYDQGLVKGQTYYYRIHNVDAQNKDTYSRIREVRAEEGQEEFSMEVLQGPTSGAGQWRVRFNSQYSQQVRIKLYDDRMMEAAILFDDFVYAGNPGLLKIGRKLAPGNYTILAETETRRFGQNFEVKD